MSRPSAEVALYDETADRFREAQVEIEKVRKHEVAQTRIVEDLILLYRQHGLPYEDPREVAKASVIANQNHRIIILSTECIKYTFYYVLLQSKNIIARIYSVFRFFVLFLCVVIIGFYRT